MVFLERGLKSEREGLEFSGPKHYILCGCSFNDFPIFLQYFIHLVPEQEFSRTTDQCYYIYFYLLSMHT